jgi:hypothetical protein
VLIRIVLVMIVAVGWIGTAPDGSPVSAAQLDPVTQCEEGVRLFSEQKMDEARPFLEAGVAGRATAHLADPSDLAICAMMLGLARASAGEHGPDIEAFEIALEAARAGHVS